MQDVLEHPRRVVEVDRREHHVARHDERLQRDDAAPVDADDEARRRARRPQRSDELLGVVAAARDAGEVGVALQVVHSVGVEVRSADELAQCRIAAGGIADDEPQHVGDVDVERGDAVRQVRQRQQLGGPRFVANSQHGFARVAERPVADVVQQQRGANEASLVRGVGGVREKIGSVARQLVEGARAHRERSQRVAEARMFGRGKREIREPELAQTAQPLHRRHVEQLRLRCG